MRYNLYLLQYNNYYNRVVKKLNTLEAYQDYLVAKIMDLNIDIKDSINTTIVINYKEQLDTPNYLLIEDKVRNVVTRWFVIECTMIRGLQYSLAIRRDVIADYFDEIMRSPCIIQKGWVSNNNVLVFNKEPQNFNKIKKSELLIKDYTESAWIVGFIDRNAKYEENGTPKKIYSAYKENDIMVDFDYGTLPTSVTDYMAIGSATPTSYKTAPITNVNDCVVKFPFNFQEWKMSNNLGCYNGDYYSYITGESANVKSISKFSFIGESKTAISNGFYANIENDMDYTPTNVPTVRRENNLTPSFAQTKSQIKRITDNMIPKIESELSLSYANNKFNLDSVSYNNFMESYAGKICEISGVYYRVEDVEDDVVELTWTSNSKNPFKDCYLTDDQLYQIRENAYMSYIPNLTPDNLSNTDFKIYGVTHKHYLKLTQITTDTFTTLPTTRNHLYDAPYDMFVMPYSDDFKYGFNNTLYTTDKDLYLNLAIEISKVLAGAVYDIQIVPYCPFVWLQDSGLDPDNFVWDFSLLNAVEIYKTVEGVDTVVGHYYFSTISCDKQYVSENRSELTFLFANPSYKEITCLNQYILCSPNEEAKWEFNPAMNKGVYGWNYSFDYKPYASYVKLQPVWKYLYGNESYNGLTDKRGLVYNGNYSITQLTDAWQTYIQNNKNYQQIFDTEISAQIKKFDMNQKAQWETVGYRNFSFNPIKSILGIVGENKQMDFDREVFNVDLSAKRDLFNYQLDNIQSLPNTLKKISSINIDFRLYPFVEIYSCTEQEKSIFRDDIRWNGMTIMAPGYIEDYIDPNNETFIKATLIRFDEFEAQENDYTLVQNINIELDKGIYITKEE